MAATGELTMSFSAAPPSAHEVPGKALLLPPEDVVGADDIEEAAVMACWRVGGIAHKFTVES